MKLKGIALFLFLVIAFLLESIVYSGSLTYYPLKTSLGLQPPPLIFLNSGNGGVSSVIQGGGTSASVSIECSNKFQVVHNPDFYSNPSYWYQIPGDDIIIYWYRSDSGASGGGALFNGTFQLSRRESVSDRAVLVQQINIPRVPIEKATLSIRYRYSLNLISYLLLQSSVIEVGLNKTLTNTNIWEGRIQGVTTSYTTNTWDITKYLGSGGDLTLYVKLKLNLSNTLWFPLSAQIYLLVDNVYLNITTSEYAFSNIALLVNNTGGKPYYTRLVMKPSASSLGSDLRANISLINNEGYSSTLISIVNGSVINTETSAVALSPVIQGYASGYIRVSAIKNSLSNSSIALELAYTSDPDGGAEVFYPINLVIDPDTNKTLELREPSTSNSLSSDLGGAPLAPAYQVLINSSGASA